ncbi:hypothetical protein TA3x_002051 [Tundrisphaera sp. TA3]|uniref:hypothetical protein n=1 Tax=Tundrisphaera sp. TA3 TaxID=3435775 RepID=UPI003EB94F4B
MRTGRRDFHSIGRAATLFGALALAAITGPGPAPGRDLPPAPQAGEPPCRITVEVDWSAPAAPGPRPADAELSVAGGRVVEATATSAEAPRPRPLAGDSWEIGPVARGRIRARVEAPPGASLSVRVAGQEARIPLPSLLEGPQRIAAGAGVEVGAERPAWDSIRVELGPGAADGTTTPGATVPVRVGFDIRTLEPGDVAVRASAELRPIHGGDPVWRQDWQEVVSPNAPAAPATDRTKTLSLAAPPAEGSYSLEIRASWEPLAGPADTRIGRLVRRRRAREAASTAVRRTTLAVLGPPNRVTTPPPPSRTDGAGVEVDAIDLGRSWGHRLSVTGRAMAGTGGRPGWAVPEAALIEPAFRDRVRGWINRGGAEPATLAAADASGMAWTAIPLRVPHPDRPHRLNLSVSAGRPAALGVALLAGPGGPGERVRVVLDACASAPPAHEGDPPASFSWPVWPDDPAPILVLVNRDPRSPVMLGSVALEELPDFSPTTPVPRDAARSLGLHLAGPRDLDRFGGLSGVATGRADPLALGKNLATYLAYCGATSVVLPDGLADRPRRAGLDGQADEDATGPDRLDVLLRMLGRKGVTAWVDVAFEGPLPGLPAPDSPEAVAEGLARLDRRGLPDGLAYQPLHPRVREAMAKKVAEAVAARRATPALAGVLVRLGPGSTLPGGPDAGLDDASFARFTRAAFDGSMAATIPGRAAGDPGRFEARARFVEGKGQRPWLSWRASEVASLYVGLAEAARRSAPGAVLAVASPGLEPGPAGDEARRVDLAGLTPAQAWRGVGFDLSSWPADETAPIVLRSVGLTTDDLAHDLATSPELDEPVAARPGRGALLGVESIEAGRAAGPRLFAIPMAGGSAGDEAMGHAVAALDATRVIVAATSAAGQEDRLRRFARPFAALPDSPPGQPAPRLASGAVARALQSGPDTVLALANDTPYPILLEAEVVAPATAIVDDLGRGLRLEPERGPNGARLVLDLPPFGIAAARVASPDVRIASARPHPDPAALDGIKAQYDDLSARLIRLQGETARPERGPGPANAGFEPETVQLAASRPVPVVSGWEASGGTIEIDRDRPRSGRGSLRLDASAAGASAQSAPFRPAGRTALTVRAWLRADRPDARSTIRLDGQAGGRPFSSQAEIRARGEWAEATFHVAKLPAGGLDSARLRFDLAGPGRLWVDDVSVTGDAPTESERLNARRDLMAALLAYRDGRYADFARKAGSHWTRHLAPDPPAIVADQPAPIRTGNASALPPNRQLR